MNKWKIVSQKSVFKKKLFNVRKIDLRSKEGKTKTHYVVERESTVSVFPLTNEYEIYLIEQYRSMLDKKALEAVAGYIEGKESPLSAAKRELKEEAGILVDQMEEIARIEIAGSVFKSKAHLFLAKGLEVGESNLQEDEEISLVKMPLAEAAGKVMTGEINHSSSAIGILMLDRLRREKKL
jgi:ADP-ribose pyrophosphatase